MVSPAAFNSLFEILSKPVDFPAFALDISHLNSSIVIFLAQIPQSLVSRS
jgi:hypothetical protein